MENNDTIEKKILLVHEGSIPSRPVYPTKFFLNDVFILHDEGKNFLYSFNFSEIFRILLPLPLPTLTLTLTSLECRTRRMHYKFWVVFVFLVTFLAPWILREKRKISLE